MQAGTGLTKHHRHARGAGRHPAQSEAPGRPAKSPRPEAPPPSSPGAAAKRPTRDQQAAPPETAGKNGRGRVRRRGSKSRQDARTKNRQGHKMKGWAGAWGAQANACAAQRAGPEGDKDPANPGVPVTGGTGITPRPASHRRHSTRHSRRQWAGSDAGYPGGPGDFPRDRKNRPDAGTPAQKPTPGRAADPAPKSDGRITSDPACARSGLCARKNFLPRRPPEPAPSMTSAAHQTEPPCYCRRNPNSKTPPLHNRAEESDRIFSRLHLRPATPGPANGKPTPAFPARNQRRRADQTRYEWIPYPLTPP